MLHKAVFLDRDGVVNEWRPGVEGKDETWYILSWDDFQFIDGAFEAFRLIVKVGFIPIVVSNQSCIGRGLVDDKTIQKIFSTMAAEICQEGGDGVYYYCPHAPDEDCACRKPKPGMLYQAAVEHNINLSESWMIGDSMSDIEAGARAEIPNLIKIDNGEEIIGYTGKYPLVISGNLLEAAKVILRRG